MKEYKRKTKTKNVTVTKDKARQLWDYWKLTNKKRYTHRTEQCSECNTTKRVGLHHVDGDKTNNEKNNHIALCWNCHMKRTKTITIKYKTLYEQTQEQTIKLTF